ncbi:VanZ family protein [Psychroserpens sp. SPM9]|uniref:VanZ family protein n=1 Tax=Psychroserpens sp. SPM9 TaxID=2975598 RepID=UPI0021A34CC3|nr:VanZ family protein [Psychroserpens sp. SPM9]MDG5490708.1 VanZ family protein [Psychroserpens sp. SPM9]
MITKLLLAVKKWALPIVIVYTLALTIASLVQLGDIPSLGSSFDDKIYHFIAYAVFTLVVYNYCRLLHFKSPIIITTVSVIIYGIIIELLQNTITVYRTLDVYDVLANALGVCFAVILLKYGDKRLVKKKQ